MPDDPGTWGDEALLALCLDPKPVRPAVKEKLMARIAAEAQYRPAVCVRATQGDWVASGVPGIAIKSLYQDPASGLSTVLVRMDPSTTYPEHRHIEAEQCLVLQGDLRWEDLEYRAGDFVVARAGSIHPRLTTEHGNMLLIVSGGNEWLSA
jgi:anti-sigma factor ChrR (cupin superfamily)